MHFGQQQSSAPAFVTKRAKHHSHRGNKQQYLTNADWTTKYRECFQQHSAPSLCRRVSSEVLPDRLEPSLDVPDTPQPIGHPCKPQLTCLSIHCYRSAINRGEAQV